MIDPICVFSIQHTGTWFACEYLLRCGWTHGKYPADVWQWYQLANGERRWPAFENGRRPIVQSHLCARDDLELGERRKHITINLAKHLAQCWDVIVPVRDPLLAVITRHIRHPDLDHRYIVHAFARLELLDSYVHWLPVDLAPSVRPPLAVDVPTEASESFLKANQAPSYNVTPSNHPLKQAYLAGDFQTIATQCGPAVDLLLDKAEDIRPLLERLGYTDLLWWTI